jgi:hypothetical protein
MQNLEIKVRELGDAKPPWWYRTLLLILAVMAPSQSGAQWIDPNDQVPPPQLVAGRHLKLLDRNGEPEKRRLKIKLRDGAITTPAPGDAGDPTLDGAWLIVKNPTTEEQDTFALPAEGWTGVGQPPGSKGWTYRDREQELGPCSRVRAIAGSHLKVVCTGNDVDLTLDEPSQGSLAVGLAFGSTLTYCAEFGGAVRKDVGTGGTDSGRGRFKAVKAPAPGVCPFLPMVRMPVDWNPGPIIAFVVKGRDADAPILGRLGAVNIYTVLDPDADAAYGAGVTPLVTASGATLITGNSSPILVDTSAGPVEWAQEELAIPFYTGAEGFLGMVTSDAYEPLLPLKSLQVGDSNYFGFQQCLHDCANLGSGGFLPPRVFMRVLAIHYTASRSAIESGVPALAAEADVTPGVRLGWAGRTVADVNIVLETGEMALANNPLGADGSLLYQLDPGIDPASVLALPELSAFIASSGEHVVVFFDLLSAGG